MHIKYKINPDMAIFGKTISNGFPMAAIIGIEDVMEAAQKTFISSAYFTDRIGPATSLQTLQIHQEFDVGSYVYEVGKKAQITWREISNSYNLNLNIGGIPGLSNFSFKKNNPELMTLFIQKMLDKGFLVTNQFYPTLAHKDNHMELYFDAFDAVMKEIKLDIDDNNFMQKLRGPVKHTGFSRLV